MGQYWNVVNLDKREFLNPHDLGCGLKLWEQIASCRLSPSGRQYHPGTGAALLILCAAMPEARGAGDLDLRENWHGPERKFPKHNATPGPMPESYQETAHRTIGRWAGDRIALVGDYAVDTDLKPRNGDIPASEIYARCESLKYRTNGEHPEDWYFTDVTADVAQVIEHELQGKYEGDGWRIWKPLERQRA